jgi:thioesterase domain-containing protein
MGWSQDGLPSFPEDASAEASFADRIEALSPTKRALLDGRLRERCLNPPAGRPSTLGALGLPLVALCRAGGRVPFFCVHPVLGVVSPFYLLSLHLGPDQPFYGFQAPGVWGEAPPCGVIEEMATLYVEALSALYPTGPVQLGGWSYGSTVAYEMARQLVARGRRIALLALFDTPAGRLGSPIEVMRFGAFVGRHLWAYVPDFLAASPAGANGDAKPERSEPGTKEEKLGRKTAPRRWPRWPASLVRPLWRVLRAHAKASARYVPGPYDGTVTLFRCIESFASRGGDPAWGWSALAAGGVTVESIPGNHMTFLREPHVAVVAARLRRWLEVTP